MCILVTDCSHIKASKTDIKTDAVNKLRYKDIVNLILFGNNMCNSPVMSLSAEIRCGLQLQTAKGGVSSDVYTSVPARTCMVYMYAIRVAKNLCLHVRTGIAYQ